MDTDVVEPSVPATAPLGAASGEQESGGPEATIDEVDQLLDEVEAALVRLDEGSYGTCRECGGTIDDDRLAGLPTARTCASCDLDAGADEVDHPRGDGRGEGSEADGVVDAGADREAAPGSGSRTDPRADPGVTEV